MRISILFLYFIFSFVPCSKAQVSGCTDPLSNNYNPAATVNDGSCTYNATNLALTDKTALSTPLLDESSGLEFLDTKLWTFNDSGNPNAIYRVDTSTTTVYQTVTISNSTNVDWEDMTSSKDYLFVGDFGNNNGNRQNLKIYRLDKTNLIPGATSVTASVINFSFSDQTTFTSLPNNNNFDCESMIFFNDSIHLFSKDWVDKQTRHYVLPNSPGTHIAQYRETLNAGFLVTGATIQKGGVIALVGYDHIGTDPIYMMMLFDYKNNFFFNGNKRKFNVANEQTHGQMEGIEFFNAAYGYVSNERFTGGASNVAPKLKTFNLAPFLPNSFVYPKPKAAASASQTTACANSTITFTDQSENDPTSWQWIFPGGTPATSGLQNPQVQYSVAGTYSVTLISGNATGYDTLVKTNYITINPLPSVTASNVSGCAGSSITLSGTPAGGTWSVANPYTGTSTTYTHTYTDGNGCSKTSTAANITVNPLPSVTASNVSSCSGVPVALSGTPAGGTWSVANPYTGTSTTYTHTYTDGNGCTNTSTVASITVNSLPSVTASDVSGCDGAAIVLSGTPAGGTWSVANPYTGPGTTYTHTFTDINGCSNTSASASITVNSLPIVSFSGLAAGYTVASPAATLTGSPAGGNFSGPGISGNTFTPLLAGIGGPYFITYSYTDGNGCSNSSGQQTTVTNCNVTGQPGFITSIGGTAKMCPGETKSYKISAVSGATSYTWSPPAGGIITAGQGTVQVTLNYTAAFLTGGTLSVVANNACGSSTARNLTIKRNTPATPGTITGPAYGVCNNVAIPYSVVNTSGITYNWSLSVTTAGLSGGQGTHAITSDFNSGFVSGTLSVTASNACGTSVAKSKTIKSTPATPTAISGAVAVCANQAGVPYFISPVATATSYTWTAMTGAHISDGVNTSSGAVLTTTSTSVAVNFGTTAGILKVKANNSCGSGTVKSLSIVFNCRENGDKIPVTDFNVVASPNPVSNMLNVFFISEINSTSLILLKDVFGKNQVELNTISLTGENACQLNVDKLSKGIYFLEVINGARRTVERIAIQ